MEKEDVVLVVNVTQRVAAQKEPRGPLVIGIMMMYGFTLVGGGTDAAVCHGVLHDAVS